MYTGAPTANRGGPTSTFTAAQLHPTLLEQPTGAREYTSEISTIESYAYEDTMV